MKKSLQCSRSFREKRHFLPVFLMFAMVLDMGSAWAQHYGTGNSGFLTSGSSYSLPQGVYKVTKLEAWGGGGGGANASDNNIGGGGGGGGYATISLDQTTHKGVTVSYSAAQQVSANTNGQNSTVSFGGKTITAYGGYGATSASGANGRG